MTKVTVQGWVPASVIVLRALLQESVLMLTVVGRGAFQVPTRVRAGVRTGAFWPSPAPPQDQARDNRTRAPAGRAKWVGMRPPFEFEMRGHRGRGVAHGVGQVGKESGPSLLPQGVKIVDLDIF